MHSTERFDRQAISIHAPRTGSDGFFHGLPLSADISIHAPRTGSDIDASHSSMRRFSISIHAPRTGSDVVVLIDNGLSVKGISIHAPRTGSDTAPPEERALDFNFNPRSPHGERRLEEELDNIGIGISIHAPRTGSDGRFVAAIYEFVISIHAPRTGSDTGARIRPRFSATFQSTLPARGATGFATE